MPGCSEYHNFAVPAKRMTEDVWHSASYKGNMSVREGYGDAAEYT